MIKNGEGTLESVSGPTSLDPSKSDDVDASASPPSHYSSCGESEFERYCSANSVMGTPTSFGLVESEFGSSRSLENFSLGGGFDRNLEDRKLSNPGLDRFKERRVEEGIIKNGACGLELCDDEVLDSGHERGGLIGDDGVGFCLNSAAGVGEESLDKEGSVQNDGWLNGLASELGLGFEMGREEDGTSSRYEHSEDDVSMYGCGSDDENRKNLCVQRNLERYNKEAKVETENPFVINSSVAFGSDDWDDFEQETGGIVASMKLDKFHEQKEHSLDTETDLSYSASVASVGVPVIDKMEIGKVVNEEPLGIRQIECDELVAMPLLQNAELEQVEEARDIPLASCQVQGAYELSRDDKSSSIMQHGLPSLGKLDQEDVIDISITCNQVQSVNDTIEHFKTCYVNGDFEMEQDPLEEKTLVVSGLNIIDFVMEGEGPHVKSEESSFLNDVKVSENQVTGIIKVQADHLSDTTSQLDCHATEYSENTSAGFFGEQKSNRTQSILESNVSKASKNASVSMDLSEGHQAVVKAESFEVNEFYDEIVNEMEEILLDSGESPGAGFPRGNIMFQSQLSLPLRDGGSTASTSGTNTNDTYPLFSQPLRIDGVEVVGAKQKKGDVSFSERLVGVKEYTVYIIRVWSGRDQWEVERRYRDFCTLYRRLKSLFADQGWSLPSPWSFVEKESRKIFGNASPDVVSERGVLIQKCLHSIIHSGLFSSPPSALVWFLCPQDSFPGSPASRTQVPQSIFFNRGAATENISTLGKTISLVVEIRPYKSTKQILEAQHYTCAGCHKHFDDGLTLMRDFVKTLGWGKPRLCEYTGQLFCSSCHSNETAVLPARVLHYWDFTQYAVSQLAKSYLDSIHEQPMLCVSAVNPFLFSKVPALQHVMGVRKTIGTMLPYVRCPFRMTINKGLGTRRYLLESNDFFALRDLIDLSKGAFAALPVMVETVSRKILEHITEQCLVCYDVGVPCSARQACNDPSSLIFPFQDCEMEKCTSCESVYHKPCFGKLTNCSCGARLGMDEIVGPANRLSHNASSGFLGRRSSSGLTIGLFSGLFSKAKPENMKDHKDGNNVILMGSLPSTFL